MVKAMINISKNANQILNIVKAKYDLKDKSQAIEKVIMEFGEDLIEPEIRPEFLERLKKIKKEKGMVFKDVEELRRYLENENNRN